MAVPDLTYLFRVIKSSWGIRISITARAEEFVVKGATNAFGKVWVAPAEHNMLTPSEMKFLCDGVRIAQPQLELRQDLQPLTIVISDLSYMETDFQEEGLTYAMLGWLTEAFGLTPLLFDVSYDRSANRYEFIRRRHESSEQP